MSSPRNIYVVGSVNLDFVIQTQTLPTAGETVGSGSFFTAPGGKGANQALAARRMGANVSMLACVGEDVHGQSALKNLDAEGVNLSGVKRLPGESSGAAFINISDSGENQIAVAPGANAAFAPEHVPEFQADAIIAQLEVSPETISAAVSSTDCFFSLNAAPALPIDPSLLLRADLLVVNEIERAFYGDALEGFSGLLACTYGAKGATLSKGGATLARCIPPSVEVIDTTGAGDCFTAALTIALLEPNQSPESALERACFSATLATTKLGAQAGMPTRDEVDAFLAIR